MRKNISPIITEIIKLSENLRSGVSKNGLLTLYEASIAFKKDLDPFLESAMQKLIKKSQDSNSFISDEVKKVMISLMVNCTEGKCV